MKFSHQGVFNMKRVAIVLASSSLVAACSGPDVRDMPGKIVAEDIVADARPIIDETLKYGAKSVSPDATKELVRRRHLNREDIENYTNLQSDLSVTGEDFDISLNLDRVEIHSALEMFAKVVDKNIVVGDEVNGVVDIRLVQVPWKKALTTILDAKALALHVDKDSGIIRIHSREALAAQENFEKDRIERLKRGQELKNQIQPTDTELFRVFYANLDKLRNQILEIVGQSAPSDYGPSVTISLDERQKSLIVKAPEGKMNLISELVNSLDQPTKQVLIEAFIVEAGKDFDKRLGAELGLKKVGGFGSNNTYTMSGSQAGPAGSAGGGTPTLTDLTGAVAALPIAGATGGIGILVNSDSDTLKVALNAMEEDKLSKTLSNPKIFTLDTETASISQGSEQPVSGTSGSGDGSTVTEYEPANMKLDVTPTVVGDGNIILDLNLQNDSFGAADNSGTKPKNTMELKTKLLVPEKSIVVIGGIYKDKSDATDSKVPLFGDLPLIGRFFRSDIDLKQRDELLIFISLHVV